MDGGARDSYRDVLNAELGWNRGAADVHGRKPFLKGLLSSVASLQAFRSLVEWLATDGGYVNWKGGRI